MFEKQGVLADSQSEDVGTEDGILGFRTGLLLAFDALLVPICSSMRLISARTACSLSSGISLGRFMAHPWSMRPLDFEPLTLSQQGEPMNVVSNGLTARHTCATAPDHPGGHRRFAYSLREGPKSETIHASSGTHMGNPRLSRVESIMSTTPQFEIPTDVRKNHREEPRAGENGD